MTIQINDLLNVSDRLLRHAVNEADHRASISRSYYAAYHDCDIWHAALPVPGALPPSGGVHAQLIGRLASPMVPQSDQKIRSKRRGYMLGTMKTMRTAADYELQQTLNAADAAQSLANARAIVAI
jgi:hypothetical protein